MRPSSRGFPSTVRPRFAGIVCESADLGDCVRLEAQLRNRSEVWAESAEQSVAEVVSDRTNFGRRNPCRLEKVDSLGDVIGRRGWVFGLEAGNAPAATAMAALAVRCAVAAPFASGTAPADSDHTPHNNLAKDAPESGYVVDRLEVAEQDGKDNLPRSAIDGIIGLVRRLVHSLAPEASARNGPHRSKISTQKLVERLAVTMLKCLADKCLRIATSRIRRLFDDLIRLHGVGDLRVVVGAYKLGRIPHLSSVDEMIDGKDLQ
jgi:hypothetical protein